MTIVFEGVQRINWSFFMFFFCFARNQKKQGTTTRRTTQPWHGYRPSSPSDGRYHHPNAHNLLPTLLWSRPRRRSGAIASMATTTPSTAPRIVPNRHNDGSEGVGAGRMEPTAPFQHPNLVVMVFVWDSAPGFGHWWRGSDRICGWVWNGS